MGMLALGYLQGMEEAPYSKVSKIPAGRKAVGSRGRAFGLLFSTAYVNLTFTFSIYQTLHYSLVRMENKALIKWTSFFKPLHTIS